MEVLKFMGDFIIYELSFRFPLSKNEDIIFDNFEEDYITKITIFRGEEEERYPKRTMKVEFSPEKLTKEVIDNIDNFIVEFLYKLTLKMKTLFPFYREKSRFFGNNIIIEDSISISDEVVIFEQLPSLSTLKNTDIKFKENIEEYKKMIRILGIAESDSVTTFLILYDWFKSWINPEAKQKCVINYIMQNKEKLEQFTGYNYEMIENSRGHLEDQFTKMRNDISHSAERIPEIGQRNIQKQTKTLIKPLLFTMTYFLKNK